MIRITLDEVKTNPYQIAKMLIANRSEENYMNVALTYGPKMCQFMDPNECYQFARTGNDFDVLDAMFVNRYVDHLYNEKLFNRITPLEYRNQLGEVLRKICVKCDQDTPMEKANCIKRIYDEIDSCASREKTNESVLTGTAPIVPYQGVVRNQFVLQNASEDLVEDVQNHKDDPKYFMKFSDEQTERYLRQYASINSGRMTDGVCPNESFDDFCKMLKRQNDEFGTYKGSAIYHPYYLMCYKHGCRDKRVLESYVEEYQNNTIFSIAYDDVMEMMESLTYNEKPSMDTVMNSSKIMDDMMHQMLDDMNTTDDRLKNYPVEKLRNFLSTSSRYIPSNYLSSMFLSQNKTIDHYIMEIDGIPVAEVKDKYLVAPVIDYALFNKPTLISMDRSGNIEINDATLDLSPIS